MRRLRKTIIQVRREVGAKEKKRKKKRGINKCVRAVCVYTK